MVELLENQVKIGNLEASVQGFNKGNAKPDNVRLLVTHLESLKLSTRMSNISVEVIQPNKGATKQFSPFALLNFATAGFKYQAEGELSRARKGGKTKITCNRPIPKFDNNDLRSDDDIRKEILAFFDATLKAQGKIDWCLDDAGRKLALSTLRITKRHARAPAFSVYYEFLDPTSNVFFLHFYPGHNPFGAFDFKDPIPNPVTRTMAEANKEYAVSYTRRGFKGEEHPVWTTKDISKGW